MPRYRATPSAGGCDPWSKSTSPQRGPHADGYELIAPKWYVLTKQEYLADIESGQLRYQFFEPASEIVVRGGGQVAFRRYRHGSPCGPAARLCR
jgi:hypothetical protein